MAYELRLLKSLAAGLLKKVLYNTRLGGATGVVGYVCLTEVYLMVMGAGVELG